MDIHHLIKMANNIGSFFESEPDRPKAVKAVADHIRSFWDPRMRTQILRYLDEGKTEGLSPIALDALRTHAQALR
jgi:formate dehydrogenase subunit delta